VVTPLIIWLPCFSVVYYPLNSLARVLFFVSFFLCLLGSPKVSTHVST
jgi:uncharacterized membrane protein YiaA